MNESCRYMATQWNSFVFEIPTFIFRQNEWLAGGRADAQMVPTKTIPFAVLMLLA